MARKKTITEGAGDFLAPLRSQLKIQGSTGNWDHDPYMHGMYNGLECALATLEKRDPKFRNAPAEWICDREKVANTPVLIHSHYKKDVSHLHMVDVYRVLKLFEVTDPAIQHAIKKLLVAGGRGAKETEQDYREAVDSINRALQMIAEDAV
jgi:hypothetical protein